MTKPSGFTLIEALAATALAAVMTAAVMTVVSALARDTKDDAGAPGRDAWQMRMAELFECDLRHAETIVDQGNGLMLTGHLALDPDTFEPVHRYASVTYHIRQDANGSWLIRTQTDPHSLALRNSWDQLVCSGVRGIVMTAAAASTSQESESVDVTKTETAQRIPLETASVTLTWDTENEQTTTISLVVR